MTDSKIQTYLRDNGYPEHIARAGRAGLIQSWREFIIEVETGYPRGLDDYRNDLDLRAVIQLSETEDDETHALDARLQDVLIATDVRVWESAPSPFWDFGYPSNAGPELIADLRAEGLLAAELL